MLPGLPAEESAVIIHGGADALGEPLPEVVHGHVAGDRGVVHGVEDHVDLVEEFPVNVQFDGINKKRRTGYMEQHFFFWMLCMGSQFLYRYRGF